MKTMSKKMLALWMLAGLASIFTPALVLAQEKAKAPPPPELERLDEGPDTGVTIVKPEPRNKITEKREKGKVNEVEVKSGKSTYTLRGDPSIGNTAKGTANGDANRPAMWTIKEFGGPKETKEAAEPIDTLPPNPATLAPASSAAATKK
ncbi:DUF2782 domain-containing protein [Undibacterium sp.]|uniref:DUF2782 domain-containing protein n=1 Tax=Undibacterium sp. TaxID=1914977 RepID=UPI00374DBD3C